MIMKVTEIRKLSTDELTSRMKLWRCATKSPS